MDNIAIITFSNGESWDIVVNGNTYGTFEQPMFPQDLSMITITGKDIFGGDVNTVYHNAKVLDSAQLDNTHFWFALVDQY